MSDDDLKHELDRLRNENATLKAPRVAPQGSWTVV